MPLTYQAAANPPPLALKVVGEAPLQVPVVAFLIVCNRSPLIAVSHPQFTQHAQFTARRPPSLFVLIAPDDVRPRIMLAFLGGDPRQRAAFCSQNERSSARNGRQVQSLRGESCQRCVLQIRIVGNQFCPSKILHQVGRRNRRSRFASGYLVAEVNGKVVHG